MRTGPVTGWVRTALCRGACNRGVPLSRTSARRRTLIGGDATAVWMLQNRTGRHDPAGLRAAAAGALALALLCTGCGPAAEPPPSFHPSTPAETAALSFYVGTVKPVFKENCYRCHYGLNRKSGFNLGTRALVLHGGSHGVAVVPGHPEEGLLMVVLHHAGPPEHPMPMPQKGEMLSQAELGSIAKWIADGAIMDR